MARAIRKQRIVESDPEEDESESDEEDKDESEVNEDERPTRRKGRASTGQTSTYSRKGAAPAAKGRLKGKAPTVRQTLTKSGGASGKGKRRAAVSDDDGEREEGDEADGDVLEVEEADDGEVDGDEGLGGLKGKQTREIAGPVRPKPRTMCAERHKGFHLRLTLFRVIDAAAAAAAVTCLHPSRFGSSRTSAATLSKSSGSRSSLKPRRARSSAKTSTRRVRASSLDVDLVWRGCEALSAKPTLSSSHVPRPTYAPAARTSVLNPAPFF